MLKPKQIDKKTNHTRKPTPISKNCSYVCVCMTVHNSRTQHSSEQFLMTFPLILQTIKLCR